MKYQEAKQIAYTIHKEELSQIKDYTKRNSILSHYAREIYRAQPPKTKKYTFTKSKTKRKTKKPRHRSIETIEKDIKKVSKQLIKLLETN